MGFELLSCWMLAVLFWTPCERSGGALVVSRISPDVRKAADGGPAALLPARLVAELGDGAARCERA